MSRYNTIRSHGGELPLPYKQEAGGSSPSAPTTPQQLTVTDIEGDPLPTTGSGSVPVTLLCPEPAIYQAVSVPLSRGLHALVSLQDADRVLAHRWTCSLAGHLRYAVREYRGKRIYLHRFITGAMAGHSVDHIDGDGLNCQRHNLRMASRKNNNRNRRKTDRPCSTEFKGVDRRKNGSYRAQISTDGKRKFLGYFADPQDAARAYDAAALQHFGEFACLNFPESGTHGSIQHPAASPVPVAPHSASWEVRG